MKKKIFVGTAVTSSAVLLAAVASAVILAVYNKLPMQGLYMILAAGAVLLVTALILSAVVAGRLTHRITKEICEIDWEAPDRKAADKELYPLIDQISKKNEQIDMQLEELKREHDGRDKMRREFTANVSHELKTPLTSISGFAEIIRDGLVRREEDLNRFAGNIYDEAQRLIALVGDIIKLSQLDEEAVPAKWEEIDLYECCGAVLAHLEPVAAAKGIQLELWGGPTTVYGVVQIVEEIVFNLCDNAVKSNRKNGYVKVSVDSYADRVELSVKDNGIGISPEEQERVFERFYRVNKSHSKEIGGTGLGLSIVKHGVAFLNAECRIDSVPGEGTRIRVLFPKGD